ncbi:MAG: hypothetical protein KGJ06_05880, partial [Pseudomonadota bacterium]|nr:hypothetical protein [Pseudomonadota bacterium]
VMENDQPRAIVSFSAPVKYGYALEHQGNNHYVLQSLHLPNRITLTGTPSAGEPPMRTVITYDANPVLRVKIQQEQGLRDTLYEFHHVTVAMNDAVEATIASILGHFDGKTGPNGKPEGKYTLAVAGLVPHGGNAPAYNLSADIDYSAEPPAGPQGTVAAGEQMQINRFELKSDLFSIHAAGTVVTAGDDPLPYGNVTLNIDNVPQFLASSLVPADMRPSVSDALQKITGAPAAAQAGAQIPMKRDKNGTFYIGNSTFEALAASALANMLQPATSLPPPEALKPTPVPERKAATPPARGL